MSEIKYYSEEGLQKLKDELHHLIAFERPAAAAAIAEARDKGDLSENAEYDAAKERRRFLQRRRSELERLVATVQPINFLEFKADTSKISMGTEVVLQDASGTEKVYSIVGSSDGDPDRNLVSYKTKCALTICTLWY